MKVLDGIRAVRVQAPTKAMSLAGRVTASSISRHDHVPLRAWEAMVYRPSESSGAIVRIRSGDGARPVRDWAKGEMRD